MAAASMKSEHTRLFTVTILVLLGLTMCYASRIGSQKTGVYTKQDASIGIQACCPSGGNGFRNGDGGSPAPSGPNASAFGKGGGPGAEGGQTSSGGSSAEGSGKGSANGLGSGTTGKSGGTVTVNGGGSGGGGGSGVIITDPERGVLPVPVEGIVVPSP